MSNDIRKRMFREMRQKAAFDDARRAAYAYADVSRSVQAFVAARAQARKA